MAEYQFEIIMAMSDVISIDADSYEEACDMARDEGDAYYPVAPAGYALSWDNVEVNCIAEPDEED